MKIFGRKRWWVAPYPSPLVKVTRTNGGTMNKQQTLQSLSNVTKTYLRISQLKTILTVFFVGYTAIKVIKTIKR